MTNRRNARFAFRRHILAGETVRSDGLPTCHGQYNGRERVDSAGRDVEIVGEIGLVSNTPARANNSNFRFRRGCSGRNRHQGGQDLNVPYICRSCSTCPANRSARIAAIATSLAAPAAAWARASVASAAYLAFSSVLSCPSLNRKKSVRRVIWALPSGHAQIAAIRSSNWSTRDMKNAR